MNLSPEPLPRTYTPDAVNAMLPQATERVKQLQQLQRSIAQTAEELHAASQKIASGNGYPIESLRQQVKTLALHQLQLIEAFQSVLKQLEETGAILKDLNKGLLDWYGLRQGELVFLCWKLGEDRILFWHGLEEGFAGRRKLEDLSHD